MELAYQIANQDLALTRQSSTLGRCWLTGVARRLLLLLDATSRGSGSRSVSDSSAARGATLGGIASLSREDLVEGLIKLARHFGESRCECLGEVRRVCLADAASDSSAAR